MNKLHESEASQLNDRKLDSYAVKDVENEMVVNIKKEYDDLTREKASVAIQKLARYQCMYMYAFVPVYDVYKYLYICIYKYDSSREKASIAFQKLAR
jgi:hypothetical protein